MELNFKKIKMVSRTTYGKAVVIKHGASCEV